jgi:hypothetical protein
VARKQAVLPETIRNQRSNAPVTDRQLRFGRVGLLRPGVVDDLKIPHLLLSLPQHSAETATKPEQGLGEAC